MKQGASQSPGLAVISVGSLVDSVQVEALFVDPCGPYPGLVGAAHCWDIERDARRYTGPWPVVAHPPCKRWTNFAALNYKRYGGEHNRPGNDYGKFEFAISAVRRWGGVLEHPAGSKAWKAFGIPHPFGDGHWQWTGTGWTCEVWQSAYGHQARKRTWLYWVGKGRPPELRWDREPGTHQVGWFDRVKPVLSKRAAARTPPEFAKELVRLAQVSAISNGVT